MSIQYVFNPFLGNLDAIDVVAAGTYASPTPTTMQADLIIGAHGQMLFRRHIVMQAGQRITLSQDAVLVGV